MKKISIITICLNAAETIEETILSVINQKYENLEYIIIDGGSTDGTIDIIKRYIERISYFISEPDKGISDAFNKGINLATGEVIGIINADDLYYEGAIKKVANYFEQDCDAEITFGNYLVFNSGDYLGRKEVPNTNLEELKYTFEMNHPTVFIKRSAYEKYGVFNLEYKLAMDYELISKMYFRGAQIRYINDIISCNRLGGLSQKSGNITLKERKQISYKNGSSVIELFIFMLKRRAKNIVSRSRKIRCCKVFELSERYNVIWWKE